MASNERIQSQQEFSIRIADYHFFASPISKVPQEE